MKQINATDQCNQSISKTTVKQRKTLMKLISTPVDNLPPQTLLQLTHQPRLLKVSITTLLDFIMMFMKNLFSLAPVFTAKQMWLQMWLSKSSRLHQAWAQVHLLIRN